MRKYLEYKDEKIHKFYNMKGFNIGVVQSDGTGPYVLVTTYGKKGSKGKENTESFKTKEELLQKFNEVLKEKLEEGYTELETKELISLLVKEAEKYWYQYIGESRMKEYSNYFESDLKPFKVKDGYPFSTFSIDLIYIIPDRIFDLAFYEENYSEDFLYSYFGLINSSINIDKDKLYVKALKYVIENNLCLETFFVQYLKKNKDMMLIKGFNPKWNEEEQKAFFTKKLKKSDLTEFANTILENKKAKDIFALKLKRTEESTFLLSRYAQLLHQFFPEFVKNEFKYFIHSWYDCKFENKIIKAFLDVDLKTYEKQVFEHFKETKRNLYNGQHYYVIDRLYSINKEKYETEYFDYVHYYLDTFEKDNNINERELPGGFIHTYERYERREYEAKPIIYWMFYHLRAFSKDKEQFETRIKQFCKETYYMPSKLISFVKDHFKEESLDILKELFLKKDFKFHIELLKNIDDLEWEKEIDIIWKSISKTDYRTQNNAVKYLAKKPDTVFSFAEKGIKAKSKTERLLSFLILIALETEKSQQIVFEYFHKEKDEKTRQILLPTINNKYYSKEHSLEQVNEIIDLAVERDALKKGLKGIPLDLTKLPAIYLQNGKELSENQVKFLLYRMSKIKRMVSDVEAKLLLNYIDKSKSTDFAKHILETFLDKGAAAKHKYIMCLAGILGDNTLLDYLKKLFKELYETRVVMANYVVSSIAMIGTDEALRFIEYVSRRYKKKASVEATAIEALEDAAEEYGIDIYELSDRIIPDFGFDGLFKTIEVNEEEYRVFVGTDFKLQFITYEGKTRKSVPKGASKELKTELKLIQKEIREVNKAQKEKLEQYMVLERRWNKADWTKFYLMNPVMFIYASTLVWGVFDKENNLQKIFHVDQDASILDIEDDEIEIDGGKIGIVHPLRFSSEQKEAWKAKFYELEIMQPFEQLDRAFFAIEEDEKETKIIERYIGKGSKKETRATQGHFEKRGWRKEMTDGGCFDLSKTFKQEGIYADLAVYGLCIDYDESIEFQEISFRKIDNWSAGEISLKDIPKIVFSEVIADMESIVEVEEDE